MSQSTFRMRRRVGAALLAGVTALGVATLAGEGVASASSVSAATLTASSYATSTSANWTATFVPATALSSGGTITVMFGSDTAGAEFTVPSSPTVSLGSNFTNCSATATGTAAVSGTSAAKVVVTLSGTNCSVSAGSPTSLTIDGLTNPSSPATATGATLGTIATSVDSTATDASNSVTFTLPAPTLSVTSTNVTTSSTNTAINPLTITVPTADLSYFTTSTTTDVIPVALQITGPSGASENFNVSGGLPTVTQTNGTAISNTAGPGNVTSSSPIAAVYPQLANTTTGTGLTTAGLTVTALTTTTASSSNPGGVVQGNTLVFGVSGSELSNNTALTFVVSGLHVDGTTAGVVTVTVSTGTASAPAASTNAITVGTVTAKSIGSATLYTVGSLPSALYGQTPDATAAAEFDHQFVSVTNGNATCTDNYAAVVATDHDFLDALSASYLEKSLGTGVLITPQTSAGPDLLAALKYAGVQRVYVVGGPLAITPAVISTLQSTPAYTCGGLATTGSNIQVFGPYYGTTADDTAAAIDNAAALPSSATMSFSGAYSASTSSYGGGVYNQTSGNATTSAPSGSEATAIVVADTDFQDDMAASGLAYKYGLPIVLTPSGSLGTAASTELTTLGIKQVIALGGNLALGNSVVSSIQGMSISVLRIAGYDYTQTAADIAEFEAQQLGWTSSTVLVAQGSYWSDAIAAAPISGLNEEPILLTEGPTTGVGSYTTAALTLAGTPSNGLGGTNPPTSGAVTTTSIQVLGGPLAVTAAQITQMQQALAAGA